MRSCGREYRESGQSDRRNRGGDQEWELGFAFTLSSFFILHEHIGTIGNGFQHHAMVGHSGFDWGVEADPTLDGLVNFLRATALPSFAHYSPPLWLLFFHTVPQPAGPARLALLIARGRCHLFHHLEPHQTLQSKTASTRRTILLFRIEVPLAAPAPPLHPPPPCPW